MSEPGTDTDPPAQGDARLDYPIHCLRPSHRATTACEALGVRTIGDFFRHDREAFLALPNCGERTYRTLEQRARQLLADAGSVHDSSCVDLDEELTNLVDNQRALRAFRDLGIRTVGEFHATPREELLRVRGFGERTYWEVHERITARSNDASVTAVLPVSLLQLLWDELEIDEALSIWLNACGFRTVGDVIIATEHGAAISPRHCDGLRRALDQALSDRRTSSRRKARRVDAPAWIRSRVSKLQYGLLESVLGIGVPPRPMWLVAEWNSVDDDEFTSWIDEARAKMLAGDSSVPRQLRAAIERELHAFEGIVHSDRLASGSILAEIGRHTNDPGFPLRLVAFLFPDEYTHHDGYLCRLAPEELRRLVNGLRRLTRTDLLPVDVDNLIAVVDMREPPPRGLVLHVLRRELRLAVEIDSRAGEIVVERKGSVADRLEYLIQENAGPLALDDILFRYRDRHRACRRARLLDELRSDSRFVEIGTERWSLRELHVDDLEILRPAAERIRKHICDTGRRANLREIESGEPLSDRSIHLLQVLLRRDPELRYLGRGVFCPRRLQHSNLVDELCNDLRRAAGEVPLSRFLQNQPESRRRLVATLFRENRTFVSPAEDRIDLLSNYPFSTDRLTQMLRAVSHELEECDGYSSLTHLRATVDAVGLGGQFLTDHLLRDLLRRHGPFDILPDDTVAQPELGVSGYIGRRVREVIRGAQRGLTPAEVLSEAPELAEFHDAVLALMDHDPLLQCMDGLHYEVL